MSRVLILLVAVASSLGTVKAVACVGGKADVVFILDASGSVGADNFQTMLVFTQNITQALDVGENTVRVGAIRYSSTSAVVFDLDDHMTKENVTAAIGAIAYTGGSTMTDLAIKQFREESVLVANGAREASLKIAVVVTDGKSRNPYQTGLEANMTMEAGHYLIAVGIGNADDAELSDIASDPDDEYKFHVDGFTNLGDVEDAIINKVCYVSEATPCYTEACLESGNWGKPVDNSGSRMDAALASMMLGLLLLFI